MLLTDQSILRVSQWSPFSVSSSTDTTAAQPFGNMIIDGNHQVSAILMVAILIVS